VDVLLVGLGRWGEKHLRVLRGLGATVWAADVAAERLAWAVKQGVDRTRAVADYRAALSHVKAADIVTPADSHLAVAGACLAAGLHCFVEKPITFKGIKFDIVVAQGVFEYMGNVQSKKFAEIAELVKDDGKFVCTYQNFAHRHKNIYWPYSNIQQPGEFRRDLSRYFRIDQAFPTAYNWKHSHPNRRFIKAPQERINVNIPVIGPKLAIDYYYLCSPLRKA